MIDFFWGIFFQKTRALGLINLFILPARCYVSEINKFLNEI